MRLLYELAMHFFGIALSIRAIYRTKKLSSIRQFWKPTLPIFTKEVVWVHAVSLGEVKAMQGIIEKLHKLDYQIVVSTITDTGQTAAKKLYPYAACLIFPLDISYIIKPLIKKVSPKLVLLSETDFWPCFLQNISTKVCVINGKISEVSYKRWKRFSFFPKWLIKNIDHFCLQDQIYYDRFVTFGIDPKKMTITGNIKIDQLPPALSLENKREKKKELGCENAFVLTLGSTHFPEEQLFLDALAHLSLPKNFTCFIVPRHLNRCKSIELLLQKAKLPYSLYSEKKFATPWILVDQMGILTQLYQISDMAFVGGSLTKKVGGHNLLEPLACGTPTIHGPFLHNQPTLADLLKKYHASYILQPEKMQEQLRELLQSTTIQKQLQENGSQLLLYSKGALEKSWQVIISLLHENQSNDTVYLLSRDGAVVSSLGS